jgi:chromosome segregation ATPase
MPADDISALQTLSSFHARIESLSHSLSDLLTSSTNPYTTISTLNTQISHLNNQHTSNLATLCKTQDLLSQTQHELALLRATARPLQEKIQQLEEVIKEKEKEVEDLKRRFKRQGEELERMEEAVISGDKEYIDLKKQLWVKDDKISDLEARNWELEITLNSLRERKEDERWGPGAARRRSGSPKGTRTERRDKGRDGDPGSSAHRGSGGHRRQESGGHWRHHGWR